MSILGSSTWFGRRVPRLVRVTGYALLAAFPLAFFAINGIHAGMQTGLDLLVGLFVSAPFLFVTIYAGYWLEERPGLFESYTRIGTWFVVGLLGFLLLNLVLIVAWPVPSTYDGVAWALFAASVGGAGGLTVGAFEARTVHRQVAAAEQRMQRRAADRRNERLEEFARVLAHDLRNPLNVAVGNVELARGERESNHLDSAAAALERMDDLIERTLTLARSGRVVGGVETVDLAEVATRSWQTVETADADLLVEDTIRFEADPDRLTHVFENLFRNAVEHGGTDVTVRVVPTADGFAVEDDGPGIPADERESVLRTGYSTAADGTGFGLAFVRQIVDAHDCRLDLDTGDDGGARFEVSGFDVETGEDV